MYSSSVASRTKQCPRVAAVACKKAMKASVEDSYDFTQTQEIESPFVPMKRVIQMNGSSIKVEIKVPNSRYSLRSR